MTQEQQMPGHTPRDTEASFDNLGLAPSLLKTVQKLGYKTPTPIQTKAIPLILQGHDLMGLAQTGTGKTAAFGLPLVHHLLGKGTKPAPKQIRALILAPTRELVNQITDNLRDFVRHTHLRVHCVVGGSSIHVQQKNLGRGTDILVATPGRLLDLVDRKAVYLDTAEYLVLDEADQMLDMGFIHALRQIARLISAKRQTMLFSATMPKQIEDLAGTYLNNPKKVETAARGKAADKVRQSVHFVKKEDKPDLLRACLAERPDDLSLVFARTKHGAEKLMKKLVAWGFKASSIHGNKSQGQRERAIRAFRNGEIRILVATDVAARGIDIPGVSHVYNYELPEVPENYVHRIGRTARAGKSGQAVAFCSGEEFSLLVAVETLMKLNIRIVSGVLSAEERASSGKKRPNRSGRRSAGPRARKADNGAGPARKKSRGKRADTNHPGAVRTGQRKPGTGKSETGGNKKRRPTNRRAA